MIKAVIFDYFGVLCSDEYWNFVKTDKNVESDFKRLSNDVNLGSLEWQDFVKEIARRTKQSASKVTELYETGQINPNVVSLVLELRKKGYKTGLLTNANYSFLKPFIDASNLSEIFDSIVVSSEVGMLKPDPKIYEYALQQLNCSPEQAVFIDDIMSNVQAAKDVGIKAILYNNFDDAKAQLNAVLSQP